MISDWWLTRDLSGLDPIDQLTDGVEDLRGGLMVHGPLGAVFSLLNGDRKGCS